MGVAKQTQQLIMEAVTHENSQAVKDRLVKWYGSDSFPTWFHVKQSLSDFYGILGSRVEYALNKSCAAHQSAYVYPNYAEHTKHLTETANGHKILYVCDLFFCLSEAEKIRALAREVSRHSPMKKVYTSSLVDYREYISDIGESVDNPSQGLLLGAKCAKDGQGSEACKQALANAYNFAYFLKEPEEDSGK
eukprot:TRINITY_DN107391_c0_g1_i1.p1 TRINITY_DN107391_c0_g1~~TRINITY_DN107391_c0_g1_i1.p1  ORF type:complete len:191 (+),score=17.86 TRINITY_DN107391_c0_g1_i1:306-878(+)